jgi:hypothetical protein
MVRFNNSANIEEFKVKLAQLKSQNGGLGDVANQAVAGNWTHFDELIHSPLMMQA